MNRLLPIILLLASIGLIYFYVWPTYEGTIVSAQQQVANYDKALSASKTFADKENTLLSEKNAIPSDSVTRLESFLPDDVDNIQLILDLTALAARTGVSVSNFSIQDSSNDSSSGDNTGTAPPPVSSGAQVPALGSSSLTDSLSLNVTVTGPYSAFRTFLAATEQSLRILDLTNLSISANSTSATNQYTYSLTFLVYWLH